MRWMRCSTTSGGREPAHPAYAGASTSVRAKRQPKYVGLLQAESRNERGEAVREVSVAESLGRIGGAAAAEHIPRHHSELIGERIELATPRPAIKAETAMQQHER